MLPVFYNMGIFYVDKVQASKALTRDPTKLGGAFLVTVVGIAGFVGLLVASACLPHQSTPLRIAALVWFVVLGAVRTAILLRADRAK